MRRVGIGLVALLALSLIIAGLGSGTAAAGNKKLVEGTVYDTTCGISCAPPCPPPCGPIPAPKSRSDAICAQASIVCPLSASPRICLPSSNCGGYPIYSGEGGVVTVRKHGSAKAPQKAPIVNGHFEVFLWPGEYVIRPYLPPEPACWTGGPVTIKVTPRLKSPVPATLDVSNSCVAHPDSR
jgi:hypothetical protein